MINNSLTYMKKLSFSLLLLFIISCDNNDDSENIGNDATRLDLVTGINIRSSVNAPDVQLGNPNITMNTDFRIFPNPPIGTVFLTSAREIEEVWIIEGNAEKSFQETDFSTLLRPDLYTEDDIDSQAILKFPDQNVGNITLDLTDLNIGYYRVFVKMDGNLYWDNIYVSDGSVAIEQLIVFWE